MAYNIYSLPDVKSVLYHQDVGQCNLHASGMGKIVISRSGDLSSHTTTADGYILFGGINGYTRIHPDISHYTSDIPHLPLSIVSITAAGQPIQLDTSHSTSNILHLTSFKVSS